VKIDKRTDSSILAIKDYIIDVSRDLTFLFSFLSTDTLKLNYLRGQSSGYK
jgi:hypothetical protein